MMYRERDAVVKGEWEVTFELRVDGHKVHGGSLTLVDSQVATRPYETGHGVIGYMEDLVGQAQRRGLLKVKKAARQKKGEDR